jgi:hypothetical protein
MNSAMDDLLDTLGSGTTLLTPNRRLARTLTEAYGIQRQAAGEQTWETPDILPWSAWLQRCWNEAGQNLALAGQPVAGLLTSLQERVLWEQVIRDASEEYTLLQPVGTARLAQEAWQLLHGWRLELHQAEFALSEDASAFYIWAQAYAKRCREANWLDDARLPHWLQTYLQQGYLEAPRHLLLIGFEEFTPQQQALLETLAQCGSRVETAEPQ